MRWRRILLVAAPASVLVGVGAIWITPATLAFYAARTAPAITRVVPTDLKDQSVSATPGEKLSYVGYEFEVPWNDLDETQTKLYPKDNPAKCSALLVFRSGLRLMVTAVAPREWINGFAARWKVSPARIESAFRGEGTKSDYDFVRTLYEFTPDKMHYWGQSSLREQFFIIIIIKSAALMKSADTGIFRLRNDKFQGFQQGDPQAGKGVVVDLYSDQGTVDFILGQKDKNSTRVTQVEINRIVQSLRKAPLQASAIPGIAEK
jgi:hypothetical protein